MGAYERVDRDGNVVERVVTVDNSHEDNRLGLAAMNGTSGWRVWDRDRSSDAAG